MSEVPHDKLRLFSHLIDEKNRLLGRMIKLFDKQAHTPVLTDKEFEEEIDLLSARVSKINVEIDVFKKVMLEEKKSESGD